jgi:hypothetical protein
VRLISYDEMNLISATILLFVLSFCALCVTSAKIKAKAYIFKPEDLIDGAKLMKIGFIDFIESGETVIVTFIFHLKRFFAKNVLRLMWD